VWVVSIWRWIALVLMAWAAPPLIARTARAISMREKRKKECPHLLERVRGLLREEDPEASVESPITPFSWFTEPELSSALVTPTVFAFVVPEGKVRRKDLEYVARYGAVLGLRDLRIYTHGPAVAAAAAAVGGESEREVSVRAVSGCACGRGS
jgi:hypothetical protein